MTKIPQVTSEDGFPIGLEKRRSSLVTIYLGQSQINPFTPELKKYILLTF